MDEVLKKLDEILRELQFHGKLLGEMVMAIDARKHEHAETRKGMVDELAKVSTAMKGTPYEGIIGQILTRMGGSHGK